MRTSKLPRTINLSAFNADAKMRAGHLRGRGVNAGNGGEFAPPERQMEAHQAIVGALRQTRRSSHDVVLDGEGDACVPSHSLGVTTPEEGAAGTHLP
ncbi:hypothetical protein SprV_0301093800 [Sparganum proliferum]